MERRQLSQENGLPEVKLETEQLATRANCGLETKTENGRSFIIEEESVKQTVRRYSGVADMKKMNLKATSDETETKSTSPKPREKCKVTQHFTDFLQNFIGSPVCETPVTLTHACELEAGVSEERDCYVRHATLGRHWGAQGGLRIVDGGNPIIRWQFGSTRPGFPLTFMFAVTVRSKRKYVVCDTDSQEIKLSPERKWGDPLDVDVDSDTSDPRLFVLNVTRTGGASFGFLHPSSTWNNRSGTLLSVALGNESKLVLTEHHSGVDMWDVDLA